MVFDGRLLPFAVVFTTILLVYLLRKMCKKSENEAQLPVHRTEAQAQDQDQDQAQTPSRAAQQDEPKGIDQKTIDSYPTVVIGQRMHLDNNICSICLSEYNQSDVLKVLPECMHRFHRDCLVEWLRLNATCPVCRTRPPRVTFSVS